MLNKLFIYKDCWIYTGKSLCKQIHEHHAIQLFVAPNSPLKINIHDKDILFQSGIIDSDVPHYCASENVDMIFINIDPDSQLGINLKFKYLAENDYCMLDAGFSKKIVDAYQNQSFYQNPYALLKSLSGLQKNNSIDSRIRDIIVFLSENLSEPTHSKKIAEMAYLSESRLLHLFKEQVKIPIRKYIQWLRIRKAVELISQGQNLTRVAHATGFADSSHFNRIFKRMFGLAPSGFLENSNFIQVKAVYEV